MQLSHISSGENTWVLVSFFPHQFLQLYDLPQVILVILHIIVSHERPASDIQLLMTMND